MSVFLFSLLAHRAGRRTIFCHPPGQAAAEALQLQLLRGAVGTSCLIAPDLAPCGEQWAAAAAARHRSSRWRPQPEVVSVGAEWVDAMIPLQFLRGWFAWMVPVEPWRSSPQGSGELQEMSETRTGWTQSCCSQRSWLSSQSYVKYRKALFPFFSWYWFSAKPVCTPRFSQPGETVALATSLCIRHHAGRGSLQWDFPLSSVALGGL